MTRSINYTATLNCRHEFLSPVIICRGDLVPCTRCGYDAYRTVVLVRWRSRVVVQPEMIYGERKHSRRPKRMIERQPYRH